MSQNKRYIPLNAGESATLPDADTLLPREEVYEPLARMIVEAVAKADAAKGKTLNELREHNAISIDGARGTGKTAVLVNLKSYLNQEKHKHILSNVHILDPVDPTLLQDSESLFLHIIVAAVLHDKDVKEAQKKEPNKARNLNQTLEKLAHSMESVETQKDRHGMDKVRAMYSNKQLADCVQDFFREVLGLLEKKLLILPIDDVDTSLNRAFENLEIVRRYLTTPYVLPIVCGDRSLYDEVTWRDFHGRLTEDSKHLSEAAYERAVELAAEYQRKILPFPRRLTMPEVSSYWRWGDGQEAVADTKITLGNAYDAMPLTNFISWLDIFLTGPVNGSEGSRPPLPIPSIRALSQLIKHCHDLIPELPAEFRAAKEEQEVRRSWQMPPVPLDKIAKEKRNEFAQKLVKYFQFEPKAGTTYLVLLAKLHWQNRVDSPSFWHHSLLDTPLFQPLQHTAPDFEQFDKADDLSAWPPILKERLPEDWLAGIKAQKTILPYPVAEVGVNSSKGWDYTKEIQNLSLQGLGADHKRKASFLITLLTQNNFYTNAKQTMLLNIGRVFELLIASIVGPLSVEDIHAIIVRSPFFSTAALAPTKTILFDEKDENDEGSSTIPDSSLMVQQLQREIATWHDIHNVNQIELSPWLVYKVFNKVFSQVASHAKVPNGMRNIGKALNTVAHTFYATWFAFGSFEKGELFKSQNVIATTNINPQNLKNYTNNDQFNLNVKPIIEAFDEDKSLKAVSIVLAHHPLKNWIDEVIKFDWPKDEPTPKPKNQKKGTRVTAVKWLAERLGITQSQAKDATKVGEALGTKNQSECQKLWTEMSKTFTGSSLAKTVLQTALQNKFPGQF